MYPGLNGSVLKQQTKTKVAIATPQYNQASTGVIAVAQSARLVARGPHQVSRLPFREQHHERKHSWGLLTARRHNVGSIIGQFPPDPGVFVQVPHPVASSLAFFALNLNVNLLKLMIESLGSRFQRRDDTRHH